jgi:uncharacterized protein YdbL (DUF1318 family)
MKPTLIRICSLFCTLFLAAPFLQAEDIGAVRARMVERLPQIDSLKASGALGESNRGFLEIRDGNSGTAVAAEENRDREVVYAELARRTGTSADAVGRARAKQIANASASGVWLQRENGEWYRK